ncbi:MAG: hypothetical protein E5V89_11535 [Mesorhizobium sp.]|uniref:hypothetical protein n=1 Tax=Mesorhizobium sp. TaxID=1871066 RepID=UPI000FEA16B8|nr:hypothetical protein [Mesorhizobium sp.]RWB50681.1 MAG: hypothetical protein EOQ47_32450 [Mesorhizobium sp.]RWE76759.1 MAG: hypothetical protein EOS63_20915 [Mesorhizobium sp.]TIV71112.1 MAG: hypothetical protein E5V89_11535 [Mesorhizobium sp.]TJW59040.1 MAG: hypothetical protein E5V97_29585 [Mesorhizobium sp.]
MHAAQAGASGVQESNSNEGDKGGPVVNRRILLAGLIATTAIGKAEKVQDLNQRIDEAAAHLAALMQARHGGSWYAEVDHGAPAALIARD